MKQQQYKHIGPSSDRVCHQQHNQPKHIICIIKYATYLTFTTIIHHKKQLNNVTTTTNNTNTRNSTIVTSYAFDHVTSPTRR